MRKCSYCKQEMIEIKYEDRIEYECWDCKKAFIHKFNLLDRILNKIFN